MKNQTGKHSVRKINISHISTSCRGINFPCISYLHPVGIIFGQKSVEMSLYDVLAYHRRKARSQLSLADPRRGTGSPLLVEFLSFSCNFLKNFWPNHRQASWKSWIRHWLLSVWKIISLTALIHNFKLKKEEFFS